MRLVPPGSVGTCPVCDRKITNTRGGLRRHKGVTDFDLATDGVCSGSHGSPLEEVQGRD